MNREKSIVAVYCRVSTLEQQRREKDTERSPRSRGFASVAAARPLPLDARAPAA